MYGKAPLSTVYEAFQRQKNRSEISKQQIDLPWWWEFQKKASIAEEQYGQKLAITSSNWIYHYHINKMTQTEITSLQ